MIDSFRHRYEELEEKPGRQKHYLIFEVEKNGKRGSRLGDVAATSEEIALLRAENFWVPMGFKIELARSIKIIKPLVKWNL